MGPGGRSTGCKTCRMRHLKCDETRPRCQRCVKGGFECRGYDAIKVFVDERSKILERSSKLRKERQQSTALPLRSLTQTVAKLPQQEVSRIELPVDSAFLPRVGSRDINNFNRSITVLPMDQDEVYMTFMRNKIVTDPSWPHLRHPPFLMDHERPRLGWLEPPLVVDTLNTPLRPAMHALARAWFARIQDHPDSAAQGMVCYGKALKELKLAISGGRWRERDVLITSMCLIVYEAIELTDPEAWINHSRGLAQLIEAQGPECFQDEFGIGILRGMRYPMILSAMARNVPVFLEQKAWCTTPWQLYPQYKAENDHLAEIFAKVPRLLSRVRKREKTLSIDAKPILKDVLVQLHEIFEWRWLYEMTHPNCVWIDNSEGDEPHSLFPHTIKVASIYDCNVLSNYNALVATFLTFAQRLTGQELEGDQMIPPVPVGLVKSNHSLLPGFDEINQVSVAREICQILRYRMNIVANDNAAFGLFFAVRMAWLMLRYHPAEEKWISGIAKQLEQLSGVQFLKLVLSEPPIGTS